MERYRDRQESGERLARELSSYKGREVDARECPLRPASFAAIGLRYADFSQTIDEEVGRILKKGVE